MPGPRSNFRALVLDRPAGELAITLAELPTAALPAGDVRVAVEWSSVNYKDALILAERGYRAQRYPMVPGIDLAGTVERSDHPAFTPGDRVVLNGAGLGETRWGGYAELAVVDGTSLVTLPASLTTRDAMAIGTAGLAAALAVLAIEDAGVAPAAGDVLVTGAAGGVGSLSVALLAARGFRVVASAGRADAHEVARSLGAADAIGRLEPVSDGPPLRAERWAAAVDTIGGTTLPAVLAGMAYGGTVAATGFAAGLQVPLHLAPLLVRGVRLLGVNTSACPTERRRRAWALLDATLPRRVLERAVTVVPLSDVPRAAAALLRNELTGRVVVDVRGADAGGSVRA